MEEVIGSNCCDVDIVVSIVIVVGYCTSEAVHFHCKSSLPRHVGKCAVLIIMIERREGVAGLVSRPIHGIDQQNILPAVVVIVENTNAAAHGFRKIFLSESATVVFEVDTGLRGHIDELDGTRGTRRISW